MAVATLGGGPGPRGVPWLLSEDGEGLSAGVGEAPGPQAWRLGPGVGPWGQASWQPHLCTPSPQGGDWGSCFPLPGAVAWHMPRRSPVYHPGLPTPLGLQYSPTRVPKAQTPPTGPRGNPQPEMPNLITRETLIAAQAPAEAEKPRQREGRPPVPSSGGAQGRGAPTEAILEPRSGRRKAKAWSPERAEPAGHPAAPP